MVIYCLLIDLLSYYVLAAESLLILGADLINQPHSILEETCPLMVARSLSIGEALTEVGVFAVQVCQASSGK